MRMSEKGRRLITEWEGSKREAYEDEAGYLTIGVGHKLTRSELTSGKLCIACRDVRWRHGLTEEQVGDLLGQDLRRYEQVADEAVTVTVSQHQFDALVSFCFNVGVSAFRRSTLVRLLNSGLYDEVPGQLSRWVYAGGRVVQGLRNRREKEINLWVDGYGT